jgi:hypothetical protein
MVQMSISHNIVIHADSNEQRKYENRETDDLGRFVDFVKIYLFSCEGERPNLLLDCRNFTQNHRRVPGTWCY